MKCNPCQKHDDDVFFREAFDWQKILKFLPVALVFSAAQSFQVIWLDQGKICVTESCVDHLAMWVKKNGKTIINPQITINRYYKPPGKWVVYGIVVATSSLPLHGELTLKVLAYTVLSGGTIKILGQVRLLQHLASKTVRQAAQTLILLMWVCLKIGNTPKPNGFADHYPY